LADVRCIECHDTTVGAPLAVVSARYSITKTIAAIHSQRWMALFMAMATILLTFIIGMILIDRQVIKSLKHFIAYIKELSTGDLNGSLCNTCNDEIGEAAKSLQKLQDSLRDKTNVAEQIAKGNLAVDVKLASQDDTLGKAMITMKKNLNVMKKDIDATIKAMKAGDIDARCHPEEVQGAFTELLGSVNDALNTVIEPMLEGIDILGEYASGKLQKEMRELPGKQIVLTEGLNGIRNNLQALIDEGSLLACAAQEGRLETRGDTSRFEGSYREIINGMNLTIENILKPVNEAVACLADMAKGDLTINVTGEYQGDHAIMKEAMNSALSGLNDILSQVAIMVDQVSNGAQQVSDSSQTLSQGTTEQASSLQEITASMTEMGSQTKQNAENATQANQLATSARDAADEGNQQMKQMLRAMGEINKASTDISRIIKVIDEIAFQTNLLALNAAVEAARAGVHGKGFAVVAEEVRNLAQRSAKAAQETTRLIEGSVKTAENGTEIAQMTAKALGEIVDGIKKVTDLVGEIASASNEQAQGIAQVNQSLAQIDQVTQSNTTSAEESASAAEELSAQAARLKQMLSKFRLKNQDIRVLKNAENKVTVVNASPKCANKAAWSHGQKNKKVKKEEALEPADVITLDDDDFGKF
ncbi:MAG: methyl-accepting chemotaxis protein, partial [bacterium]